MTLSTTEKKEYRLENLTCASCAMKFENNVKNLPSVDEANVNFGASKLSIVGNTTIEELEEAGAFDGIKVKSATERKLEPIIPFYKRKENIISA
ncbi:heavy-metal-associated domain-containing protein, partial [Microvirga sp. 3-52]|nr:heavy-metal-associated domain-containing protein [Microvirga sp. 3-52]